MVSRGAKRMPEWPGNVPLPDAILRLLVSQLLEVSSHGPVLPQPLSTPFWCCHETGRGGGGGLRAYCKPCTCPPSFTASCNTSDIIEQGFGGSAEAERDLLLIQTAQERRENSCSLPCTNTTLTQINGVNTIVCIGCLAAVKAGGCCLKFV